MKKLLLLCLVLLGGVMQVSAAKLYVNISNVSWWTNVRIYAYNSNTDNNGWDYSETGVVSTTSTLFGKNWYVFDMGSYSNAIIQYFETSGHNISNKSTAITGITNDRFVFIQGTTTSTSNPKEWGWYENGYTFRSNILDNWSAVSCNMTIKDANTLSYTLSKSVIKSSGKDKIWFRLLNQEGQIYPKADGTTLSYAVGTSEYYNNWDGTSWSFGINIPSFDYEKIVVTASLSGTTWTIKADAYISKTITAANEYATLGCSVPLDITSLPTDITAYTLSTTGKTINKEVKATALLENKGVLLHNTSGVDKTFSIPVAASGTADTSNQLVAFTGTGNLTQPDPAENKTYYILTKKNDNVGFYKVNTTSGNSMGANTAYLEVDGIITSARDFFVLEGETTGIANLNINDNANFNADAPMYNLAGQRVGKNYKGVVIVNGKKMILK